MKEEIIKILVLERKDLQGKKRYLFELMSLLGATGGALLVYFVTKYCSYSVFQVLGLFTIIMLAFLSAFRAQR